MLWGAGVGDEKNKQTSVFYLSICIIRLWVVYHCLLSWKSASSSRVNWSKMNWNSQTWKRGNHGAKRQIPWLQNQFAHYWIPKWKCCGLDLISTLPKQKGFLDLSLQHNHRASSVIRGYDHYLHQELSCAVSGLSQSLINVKCLSKKITVNVFLSRMRFL